MLMQTKYEKNLLFDEANERYRIDLDPINETVAKWAIDSADDVDQLFYSWIQFEKGSNFK